MRLLISAGIAALLAQSAIAELKIPRSVFKMETLDEAKAEAVEEKEPLVFVLTDPGTT